VYSQKIPIGKYCTPKAYTGYCINFKPDFKFELNSWDCVGGFSGSGSFLMKKDSLILNFHLNDTIKSEYKVIEKIQTNSDSISVQLNVSDKDGRQKIPYAKIYFSDSLNGSIKTIRFDSLGEAHLKLKKEFAEKKINVQSSGYQSAILLVNPMENMKITILLVRHEELPIHVLDRYKVVSFRRNKLILDGAWFRTELSRK